MVHDFQANENLEDLTLYTTHTYIWSLTPAQAKYLCWNTLAGHEEVLDWIRWTQIRINTSTPFVPVSSSSLSRMVRLSLDNFNSLLGLRHSGERTRLSMLELALEKLSQ